MRRNLLILAAVAIFVGGYNGLALVWLGTPFWIIWGVVFGLVVPIAVSIEAWRRWDETVINRLHPSLLMLSLVALFEGAMLPLVERVLELSR